MANKITAWDLPSIGTGIGSSVQSEGRTEKPMAWGKGIFWRWEWEEVGVEQVSQNNCGCFPGQFAYMLWTDYSESYQKHCPHLSDLCLCCLDSMRTATLGIQTDSFYGGQASSSLLFWMRQVFSETCQGCLLLSLYSFPKLFSLLFILNQFPTSVAESALNRVCRGLGKWEF